MRPAIFKLALAIALTSALYCSGASAQTDGYLSGTNLQGIMSGNTYQFGQIDNINLGTGAVNINIPLFSLPGRKLNQTGFYGYSSKMWIPTPYWDPINPTVLDGLYWEPSLVPYGYVSGTPGGLINDNEQEYDCTLSNKSFTQYVDSNFTYQSGDGTYLLPNRHIWNLDGSNPISKHCSGVKLTIYDVANSNEGQYQLDTTNWPTVGIVTGKDGTRVLTGPSKVEDANGNEINASGDTMLRTTLKDSNGDTLTFPAPTVRAYAATSFTTTMCNLTPVYNYTGAYTQTTSLTLPNSWVFNFTYNSDFGDIAKVTLPSGGYVRYDYQIVPGADVGPPGTYCNVDSRRIYHRYVSPDGNSAHEQTWTYNYTSASVVKVTDPLGNYTIHSFATVSNVPHEVSTQYYTSGGTLLKTVATTWADDEGPVQSQQNTTTAVEDYINWRTTDSTTTLNDTNQVSDVQTDYDSYSYSSPYCPTGCTTSRMNPAQTREYDYGSGAAGSLVRKTSFTYVLTASYINAHIWNLVATKTILDSSNNQIASTQYLYDTLSMTASGAVQHDAAYNYSAGITTRGNLTAMKVWRNTDNTYLTTSYQHDDAGNVVSMTDPNGNVTSYSYADNFYGLSGTNTAAYLTKTTQPVTNGMNHIERSQYYFNTGLPSASCDQNFPSGSACAYGLTAPQPDYTSSSYDIMNRTVAQTRGDGGQTTYTYTDTPGALAISETDTATPSPNQVRTAVLDGLGRAGYTAGTSPPAYPGHYPSFRFSSDPACSDSSNMAETVYDGAGNVSSTFNNHCSYASPTDGHVSYTYDALGRVTLQTLQDGSQISTAYSGNSTTVTDPAGKKRKSLTDGLGRLTQVFEDPSGLNLETDYTYDLLDNLTQVKQQGGTTTSTLWRMRNFVYNSLSQLTSATNPESGAVCYGTVVSSVCQQNGYDSNGNLLTKTDARGVKATSTYDQLNRVLTTSYTDGVTPTSTFVYDQCPTGGCPSGVTILNSIGRLVNSYTSNAKSFYSYDVAGRIKNHYQSTPQHTSIFTFTYNYDLAGGLTSYTDAVGITITQSLTGSGNIGGITSSLVDASHPATLASSGNYWPTGQMQRVTYGNSVTEASLYNPQLQACRIDANTSGTYFTTASQCTGAAPSGNLQDLQTNWNAAPSNNGSLVGWSGSGNRSFNRTYTYDSLNRLSTMSAPSDPTGCTGLHWTYDNWGNRTAQLLTSGSCQDTFSASFSQNTNRMDNFTYDASGNLSNDGSHNYFYDANGHIIQVDGTLGTCSTATACYIYDAEGRRVERNLISHQMDYVYNTSGQVINEWQNYPGGYTGSYRVYMYLNGFTMAEYEFGTTYFAHDDHLGSTRLLTNYPSPTPYDWFDYAPFGEQWGSGGGSDTAHKFTGKERDPESGPNASQGLDDLLARYYASTQGRFMSPDPTNFGAIDDRPQTWNGYMYAANNPLVAIDPDGLDCIYSQNITDTSVLVTVVEGDCKSDTDDGIFVDGTVDVDSLTYNGRTLGYNFSNPDNQTGGSGDIYFASNSPTGVNANQLNPFAQGVFNRLNRQPIQKFVGAVYGASVILGSGAGVVCYVFCDDAEIFSLGGDSGTDLIDNRALNQSIGDSQRKLLSQFFKTGTRPEGLSERSLSTYKTIAQRAIEAGKDVGGEQARRLLMIDNALK